MILLYICIVEWLPRSRWLTHPSPHLGSFFLFKWWEHLRSTLSSFQVCNTVLLTMVTMLNIRSSELILHIIENLYPLTYISPFPSPPAPGNHHSTLCFCKFSILDSTCKWDHAVFVFVWLISLSVMPSRFIHVVANGRISFFFMD